MQKTCGMIKNFLVTKYVGHQRYGMFVVLDQKGCKIIEDRKLWVQLSSFFEILL